MILSLNEVEGTVLKAARGAGLAWGEAEDVAQAARWLAEQAVPWCATLARLLADRSAYARPADRSADSTRLLCPLMAGLLIGDQLQSDHPLTLENVAFPVWLLPFAAERTSATRAVALDVDGARTLVLPDRIDGIPPGQDVALKVRIEMVDVGPGARPPARAARATVDPTAWKTLQTLETRTYVPVSEHSRIAGAGAGLTDND